ncbi:MAG: pyruvate kinase [Gammaproteobacteria bacterium]
MKAATQNRQTKIIATLGPATDDLKVLTRLIAAGADVLRINTSHGTPEDQLARARLVREAASNAGREVALLVDLQGPKIRVESFRKEFVELKPGQTFVLDASPEPELGDEHSVGVTYKGLARDVEPNDVLLLDDGLITLRVVEVDGPRVICEVETGGRLSSRKGINLKGGGLSIPGIAERDREDILRAAEMEADYVAVSFPRNAEDMEQARRLLCDAGSHACLVAKIERTEALENLEEIIEASHAVLVARGDLGVEIGDAELPAIQKHIIRKALDQNRIVITATQMMQSMVESPIPTRAEVLDVANAVIDGTDAVMLSAETAVGKHPVTVIEAMHRVCLGAERHVGTLAEQRPLNVRFQRIDQAIASAAMFLTTNVRVDAIIALTESGSTAQWLSRVRSSVPIYALSPLAVSRRRMALYRDVYPIPHVPQGKKMEKVLRNVIRLLLDQGRIKVGDRVILTMGDRLANEGGTNTMRFVQVADEGIAEGQNQLELG